MRKRVPFRNMRYTRRTIAGLSAVVIAVYLLFAVGYLFFFRNAQTDALEKECSQQLQTACERIAQAFNECSQLVDTLCRDNLVLEYLTAKPESVAELVVYRYQLYEVKTQLITSFPGIDFSLYALDESVFPLEYIYPADRLPESILEYARKVDVPQMVLDEANGLVKLYWPCDALEGVRLRRIAVAEVSMPLSRIELALNKMTGTAASAVSVWTENRGENEGGFFLTENQSFDNLLTLTGKIYATKHWFYVDQSAASSAALLCEINAGFPNSVSWRPILAIGLTLVLALLLLGWTVWKFASRLLEQVASVIDSLDCGMADETDTLAESSENEFEWIRRRLKLLIEKLDERHISLQKQIAETKEIETQLLQDLINPHFLYNTLEGIRWACGNEQISCVIDSMISFYRQSLNRGVLYLPLEKEMSLLEYYAQVQRFAYDSQFRLEMDVPEELKDVTVIKCILQPFVENALLHGIDKQGSRGVIRVTAREEAGRLRLTVEDNGCGMEAEKAAELLDERAQGYGIPNVRHRLQNIYGDDAVIRIESEPGKGTRVLIEMPARHGEIKKISK